MLDGCPSRRRLSREDPPRATTVTGSPVHHQIYPNLLPQPLLTQLSPRVTGT